MNPIVIFATLLSLTTTHGFFLSDLIHQSGASTFNSNNDFVAVKQGYEFIYHDIENLLLVIHDNEDCYFCHMADNNVKWTTSASLKRQAEQMIIDYIEGKAPAPARRRRDDSDVVDVEPTMTIKGSSLAAMRDIFQDRLADYHCMNKNIYEAMLAYTFWVPPTAPSGDDK